MWESFLAMFEAGRLTLLVSGVMLGLVIGIIPGLGGMFALSILLPFTFTMDLSDALTLMLSILSVTVTGDTITCVLLGVPGTSGSIATVLDGHPLAKKGQASRALGASYTASLIGGLFGALLLTISIPIMQYFIVFFGPPEVLMLAVFGLTMVGTLSGRVPRRGIAVAALGVLMATVGRSPHTGHLRYTFGYVYLWDGIPLVPVALGLYAFPEILSLALTKESISAIPLPSFRELLRGQFQGAKDALRNWFLILRCSSLGAWIGFVPGLGGSIADWFAYGHAKQTCKHSETFGTGDIRGVIASECSNNAKEGGALIPTVGFGIPGSGSMALLIGAMITAGIQPGRYMLTEGINITYTLIWTVALANILAAGICFAMTSQLARITYWPYYIILSIITPLLFLAAFMSTRAFEDIIVFLFMGGLGYLMKLFGWPRPPLIVGFILGEIIEINLVISTSLLKYHWLTRPMVLIIFFLIIAVLTFEYIRTRREKRELTAMGISRGPIAHGHRNLIMTVILSLIFLLALLKAWNWDLWTKFSPVIFLSVGFLAVAIELVMNMRTGLKKTYVANKEEGPAFADTSYQDMDFNIGIRRAGWFFGWIFGFLAGIVILGFHVTVPMFALLYMKLEGKASWRLSVSIAVILLMFILLVFDRLLNVSWPASLLMDWLSVLT